MNPKMLVVKFRRGLDLQIQNTVATMANRCPSNTAPTTWYKAARNIDLNRASNEAFCSAYCTTAALSPTHLTTQFAAHPLPTQAHVRPTPGHPGLMDIDTSQRRAPLPPTCYHCNK